jgi:putative FmdB family regulatory protein
MGIMPSYEFECPGSAETLDVVVSIHDTIPESVPCPTCGAKMRRIYNTPGVIWNAKGFYGNGG